MKQSPDADFVALMVEETKGLELNGIAIRYTVLLLSATHLQQSLGCQVFRLAGSYFINKQLSLGKLKEDWFFMYPYFRGLWTCMVAKNLGMRTVFRTPGTGLMSEMCSHNFLPAASSLPFPPAGLLGSSPNSSRLPTHS